MLWLAHNNQDGRVITKMWEDFLNWVGTLPKQIVMYWWSVEAVPVEVSDEQVSVRDVLRDEYFNYQEDYNFGKSSDSQKLSQKPLFHLHNQIHGGII